jgi:hypothetical protein
LPALLLEVQSFRSKQYPLGFARRLVQVADMIRALLEAHFPEVGRAA